MVQMNLHKLYVALITFVYLFLHEEHVHLLPEGLGHFLQQLFDLQRPLERDDPERERESEREREGSEVAERSCCCVWLGHS